MVKFVEGLLPTVLVAVTVIVNAAVAVVAVPDTTPVVVLKDKPPGNVPVYAKLVGEPVTVGVMLTVAPTA